MPFLLFVLLLLFKKPPRFGDEFLLGGNGCVSGSALFGLVSTMRSSEKLTARIPFLLPLLLPVPSLLGLSADDRFLVWALIVALLLSVCECVCSAAKTFLGDDRLGRKDVDVITRGSLVETLLVKAFLGSRCDWVSTFCKTSLSRSPLARDDVR